MNHKLIGVIVCGKDDMDAIINAEDVLSGLCRFNNIYEWHGLSYESDFIKRWGKMPRISLADSKSGIKIINDRWGATKEKIDKFIKSDPGLADSLTSDEKATDVMTFGDPSEVAYLYDEDGREILSEEDLNDALKCKKHKNENVYVVPADVGY